MRRSQTLNERDDGGDPLGIGLVPGRLEPCTVRLTADPRWTSRLDFAE